MAELQKTLQRRSIKLQKLIDLRDRLRKDLSKLDKLIEDVGGVVHDGQKPMRRRPKIAL